MFPTKFTLTNTENHDILTTEIDASANASQLAVLPLSSDATEIATTVSAANDGIAVACVGGDSSSACTSGCCNNTMASAIPLTVENWKNGEICCPGGEVWYQFSVPSDSLYSIHSDTTTDADGYFDVTGTLFDCCGNKLAYSDDDGENINFRIIHELKAGRIYYLKVKGYRDNVGTFKLIVTSNVTAKEVFIEPYSVSLDWGETQQFTAVVYPTNATNKDVRWWSDDESIATVDNTGKVTAVDVGITTIHSAPWNARGWGGKCTVAVEQHWGSYKTPVILLHGRTSNSWGIWGAENDIKSDHSDPKEADNNHFNSETDATSLGGKLYTDVSVQKIHNNINSKHEEGGNLAYYLTEEQGYVENINLFVFNYPNQDAVVHNAEKFKIYIENLTNYVKNQGTSAMKYSFYASRADYDADNYKFNIVAHSMGGTCCQILYRKFGPR